MNNPFIIHDGQVYLRAADIKDAVIHSSATNSAGKPLWSLSKEHGAQINVETFEGSVDAELERVIRGACRKGYEAIAKDFPWRPENARPGYEPKTAETESGQAYTAGVSIGSTVDGSDGSEKSNRQAESVTAAQPVEKEDAYPETQDASVILAWLARRLRGFAI